LQPLWVLLGSLPSQHLFGMSAKKHDQQIKLSGSSIRTVTVTVMSHGGQECHAGFGDAQDNCHTAVPAFPMRTIHLVIEATDHDLQGLIQRVG